MDEKHYWAIAERDLEIQNPITDRKLRLLDDYCDIRDGLRVLDIGCGKAWLMRQWAERYAIDGVGIDVNPEFLAVARARPPARGRLSFVQAPADTYEAEPGSFDIVMCLGASFALGGFVATIDWLTAATRPGGTVVIGDLTLKHEPPFRSVSEILPTNAIDTMAVVERHGAEVSAVISASDADFERYVSHHRHSTLRWGREHADHPDHAAVLERSRADWTHYLRIVRPYLGWTIFVARRDGG
jgi:cyclopropane fatty-acyl-phospholipid synthase-like methyltransferase